MTCTRILSLLFLLLIAISFQATAQDYLITSKGDSLCGDIKMLMVGADKKIMINQNKKKTYFSIFQIRTFRLKDDMYIPAKGPNGFTFMKVIREGYVSLLGFQPENQVSFDGLFLLKKDGNGIEVPNLGFEKAMKKFLAECNSVVHKLDTDVYGRKDLDVILLEYNNCINGKSEERGRQIVQKQEQVKKISPWDELESKVKSASDFSGKSDALDMIQEIKNKISRSEKVPNFMIEGLKSSLSAADVQAELTAALQEIQ